MYHATVLQTFTLNGLPGCRSNLVVQLFGYALEMTPISKWYFITLEGYHPHFVPLIANVVGNGL